MNARALLSFTSLKQSGARPEGKRYGNTHVRHLHVDLFYAVTLAVGDFFCDQLQHAHAEGVDVHLLVVDAVRKDLRRHKLRGPGDRHLCAFPQPLRETQIADHDLGRLSVDENV